MSSFDLHAVVRGEACFFANGKNDSQFYAAKMDCLKGNIRFEQKLSTHVSFHTGSVEEVR